MNLKQSSSIERIRGAQKLEEERVFEEMSENLSWKCLVNWQESGVVSKPLLAFNPYPLRIIKGFKKLK